MSPTSRADAPLPAGFRRLAFARLASTNDEARRLAEDGAAAGLVVTADEQTRGRGRHGRGWTSPPGNLYCSLLLRPDMPPAEAAGLAFVAGLGLIDGLRALAPPGAALALKWPNDFLIDGAKAAGILIESGPIVDGRCRWLVIGTGVNCMSAPTDTPYPATSLAAAGFSVHDPDSVLAAWLGGFALWESRWRADGFVPVRAAWLAAAQGLGGLVRVQLGNGSLEGRFVDLSPAGALCLEDADGLPRMVAAGDVFFPAR